jgi:hypothetical protein
VEVQAVADLEPQPTLPPTDEIRPDSHSLSLNKHKINQTLVIMMTYMEAGCYPSMLHWYK